MRGMQRHLKASWTFYSNCQGSVENNLVFTQELYCSSTCVVVQLVKSAPSWAASSWECLCWPLGAGAQSNPREGNGGEGFECGTNRKQALCSFLLSGAHERFIPNFVLARAYLTQYALPGAYITGPVEGLNSHLSLWNLFSVSLITFLSSHRPLFKYRSVSGFNGRSWQNATGCSGNASDGKTRPFLACSPTC